MHYIQIHYTHTHTHYLVPYLNTGNFCFCDALTHRSFTYQSEGEENVVVSRRSWCNRRQYFLKLKQCEGAKGGDGVSSAAGEAVNNNGRLRGKWWLANSTTMHVHDGCNEQVPINRWRNKDIIGGDKLLIHHVRLNVLDNAELWSAKLMHRSHIPQTGFHPIKSQQVSAICLKRKPQATATTTTATY